MRRFRRIFRFAFRSRTRQETRSLVSPIPTLDSSNDTRNVSCGVFQHTNSCPQPFNQSHPFSIDSPVGTLERRGSAPGRPAREEREERFVRFYKVTLSFPVQFARSIVPTMKHDEACQYGTRSIAASRRTPSRRALSILNDRGIAQIENRELKLLRPACPHDGGDPRFALYKGRFEYTRFVTYRPFQRGARERRWSRGFPEKLSTVTKPKDTSLHPLSNTKSRSAKIANRELRRRGPPCPKFAV